MAQKWWQTLTSKASLQVPMIPLVPLQLLSLSLICVLLHNSKASKFKKFTETKLLAQFDSDIQSVEKMSLQFSTGNVFEPKRKLRVLRTRLTHLEGNVKYATFCNSFKKCSI